MNLLQRHARTKCIGNVEDALRAGNRQLTFELRAVIAAIRLQTRVKPADTDLKSTQRFL